MGHTGKTITVSQCKKKYDKEYEEFLKQLEIEKDIMVGNFDEIIWIKIKTIEVVWMNFMEIVSRLCYTFYSYFLRPAYFIHTYSFSRLLVLFKTRLP